MARQADRILDRAATADPAPEPRKLWTELDALIQEQYADMARDRGRSLPTKPNKFRQHRYKT